MRGCGCEGWCDGVWEYKGEGYKMCVFHPIIQYCILIICVHGNFSLLSFLPSSLLSFPSLPPSSLLPPSVDQGARTSWSTRAAPSRDSSPGATSATTYPAVIPANQHCGMVWDGIHVTAVWVLCEADVVGVLVGYHGTRDLLCNVRNLHGYVRLLHSY